MPFTTCIPVRFALFMVNTEDYLHTITVQFIGGWPTENNELYVVNYFHNNYYLYVYIFQLRIAQ